MALAGTSVVAVLASVFEMTRPYARVVGVLAAVLALAMLVLVLAGALPLPGSLF